MVNSVLPVISLPISDLIRFWLFIFFPRNSLGRKPSFCLSYFKTWKTCIFLSLAAFIWYWSIFCLCVDTNYSFSGTSKLLFPKCLCIFMGKKTSVKTVRRRVQFQPHEYPNENLYKILNVFFLLVLLLTIIFACWTGLLCESLKKTNNKTNKKNTEVMLQDPALSQFHSGNRSRLLTGSGRNKTNAFLNYSHLPRSLKCLEATPHCAPWGAHLVLTTASAPQWAIFCAVPLSHLLQILCCINNFAK